MANVQNNGARVDWDPTPVTKKIKNGSALCVTAATPLAITASALGLKILGVPIEWAIPTAAYSVTMGCASMQEGFNSVVDKAFENRDSCGSKSAIKSGY